MSRKQTHPEYQYLNLIKDILENGSEKKEFNSCITLKGVFGRQLRFDLSKGYPLLTTKKVFVRGIIRELLWFLKGDSNIKYLIDNDVHIWDEWAYKKYTWRVKKNPMSYEQFADALKNKSGFVEKY